MCRFSEVILSLLLFAILVHGKPPKNLSRMRNKNGLRNDASVISSYSMTNNGQQITVYEDGLDDEKNGTMAEDRAMAYEETTDNSDPDDLDDILAEAEFESMEIQSTTPVPTSTHKITTTAEIARVRMSVNAPILQPQTSDTEILEHLLSKGYDWRVRPPGQDGTLHGGPVVVSVNMLIRSISKIDNVNMEYSVQLTFRESWRDIRLQYEKNEYGNMKDNVPDFLILTAGQQIWMPDSFFQNEKQAYKHMIDKPNVLIRVHKNGEILYSVRISLVLSCPMHLQFYPMDVQKCLIDLASYAYTTKDIEYVWKSEEPVQLKKGLSSSLPSFQLRNVSTGYCTSNTNTGAYSCLRTTLELRRQFSYYLLQLYIPSCMLVIVSWVSFWIDRNAVPARVTLGVTTLLTMTTQSSGINAKLPPVAYIKAIDVWIGACMTFIFGALLEFAWVTYIANRIDGARKKEAEKMALLAKNQAVWVPRDVAEQEREVEKALQTANNRKYRRNALTRWIERHTEWHDPPKRADLVSRVLFPLSFLSFNIAYWTHYAQYEQYESRN
ncbi:unnamed protein product [Auanema sp. JU1783]|nr:unnamed protein product [Auanema sp. JU1783]